MATPSLTVYGATGYTGRLCAFEAARHDLPLRIAGRDAQALEALKSDLPGDADVAVADARDPDQLEALAGETTVLLSTVAPYEKLGRPVVDAALAGGAQYVDVSGEVGFLDWAYAQHERAVDAGVALCPGFGFDGFLGELLAAVAARELEGRTDGGAGAVREARIAYLTRGVRPSAGTARTMLGVGARGGAAWVEGTLVDEPVGAHRWRAPFPEPLGPRGAVSAPLPEILTVPRSTGARTVRTYAVVPASGVVSRAAGGFGAATRAAARTPLWSALQAGVDLLPDGPGDTTRARARMAVLAEVAGPAGSVTAWARMRDVYGATARIAVGVSRWLLLDGPLEPGALTPSQALGADIDAFLDEIGADWTLLTGTRDR